MRATKRFSTHVTMPLFTVLIVLYVVAGALGLVTFWGAIATRKGSGPHRKWGRAACYGFMGAGLLAIAN